ncbi:MAG: hypothetical protein AMXMBFR58_19660 [Phycisphaerae bacterium]
MFFRMHSPRSFFEMAALTVQHNRLASRFSHELLLAIFWDRSLFRNTQQPSASGNGLAVGFSRMDVAAICVANFARTGELLNGCLPHSPQSVLLDEAASVQATVDCLEGLGALHSLPNDRAVLDAFAGEHQRHLPMRWLACEAQLRDAMHGAASDPLKWDCRRIETALRLLKAPESGSVPLGERLFPHRAMLNVVSTGRSAPAEPGRRALDAIGALMHRRGQHHAASGSTPLVAGLRIASAA